jgi:transcriptional regulator with XRE-family HTH domain
MQVARLLRWIGSGSHGAYRRGNFWTTEKIAVELGVTPATIKRWRNGTHSPAKQYLARLRAFEQEMQANLQTEMFGSDGSVQRESVLRLNVALDEAAAFDKAQRFPAPATFVVLPEKKRRTK